MKNDLTEMLATKFEPISEALQNPTAFAEDKGQFDRAMQGDINHSYVSAISDFISDRMTGSDDQTYALCDAFYGLASDMHLQSALTADALNLEVSFDNYFDLYQVGVNYAIEDGRVLIMNYRAFMK